MALPLFAPRRAELAFAPDPAPTRGVAGKRGGKDKDRPLAVAAPAVSVVSVRVRHAYAREAAALLLLATALFALLAMLSFQGDPLRTEVIGADWVGPAGAASVRVVVETIGIAAWFLPAELALLAAPLLNGKRSIAGVTRIAGDLVVVFILAALAEVAFPRATAFGAMPIGGAVGELFGEVLRTLFSGIGSYIIGLTIVGLILIGRATFSFIDAVKKLEAWAIAATARITALLRAVFGAWVAAREIDAERRADERKIEGPRIAEHAPEDAIIAALTDDEEVEQRKSLELVIASQTGLPPPALARSLASLAEAAAPVSAPPVSAPVKRTRASKKKVEPKLAPTFEHNPDPDPTSAVASSLAPPTLVEPSRAAIAGRAAPAPASEASPPSSVLDEDDADDDRDEPVVSAPPTLKGQALVQAARALPVVMAPVVVAPAAAPPVPAASAPAVSTTSAALSDEPPAPVIIDTSAAQKVVKAEAPVRMVPAIGKGFRLPAIEFLDPAGGDKVPIDHGELRAMAQLLEKTLSDYGVSGKVGDIHPGPTVTTFEVSPAAGTKVSKVAGLADDLALGLSRKVRIIAPIPGKNRIGFEIPNQQREPVNLRELVEDQRFLDMKAPLPCVLGRDIIGTPYFADLASMPHVIVAGATGAGKSVGLNVMLVSLLFRRTPAELRLLMIDPKVVELAPFDRIPHMLLPVVTDMKQAATALKWAVDEMERRYQLFANAGTKNITTYNNWVERVQRGEARPPKPPAKVAAVGPDGLEVEIDAAKDGTDAELPEKIPFIVIVVDEFADLMMQQGKDVEASVARLAQKARAAGMHVILATQRPSVDVITGMIKANFPTRIAFRVAQKVDSRTILDEQGAEHLLGRGDMLVKMNGANDTRRVQCPFCSEEEVQRITDFLRLQGEPVYDEAILKPRDEDGEAPPEDAEMDPMYDAAVRIVADTRRCSTSWIQRKLGVGYNRAAKIVEAMEKHGVVGPSNGAKDREVLIGSM